MLLLRNSSTCGLVKGAGSRYHGACEASPEKSHCIKLQGHHSPPFQLLKKLLDCLLFHRLFDLSQMRIYEHQCNHAATCPKTFADRQSVYPSLHIFQLPKHYFGTSSQQPFVNVSGNPVLHSGLAVVKNGL